MKTSFTYLDDKVIEFVVDGETLTVNVLPALLPPEPVTPAPAYLPPPDPAPVAAPLELCVEAPAPTPKKRTIGGVIRAGWFIVFTATGESLTYALNNLTSFNLPPGTATAIGAVGYGLKRALYPDTTL